MSAAVHQICPGCKVRLVIRPSYRLPLVTCPRCLTEIPNPQASGGRALSSPPPAGAGICPVCAEELPGHAAHCPTRVDSPKATRRSLDAPSEAAADSSTTQVVASFLVLGLTLGVAGTFGPMFAMPAGLVLLFALVAGPSSEALNRVVSMIGYLILIAVVLFGLALAAVFIMCSR